MNCLKNFTFFQQTSFFRLYTNIDRNTFVVKVKFILTDHELFEQLFSCNKLPSFDSA